MYKNFFGLKANPFNNSPDPGFLYMMPQTREALAGLEHGIAARKGFIVLTGEVGTGKTTLLRRALAALDPTSVATAFLFNPRLDILDFLEFVLADFGLTPRSRTKASMLIQLNHWLIERHGRNQTSVIVVDEAQNLAPDLLEEIRLLSNLETSSEKLLQIVLCGQPEFEAMLRRPELRQLRQRVSLWCRTEALTHEQTAGYIASRLSTAGATTVIFPAASVALIYQASHGIPRIINLICEHSLIAAYVDQTASIAPETVASVIAELDLASHAFSLVPGSDLNTDPTMPAPRDAAALPTTQDAGDHPS